MKKDFNVGYFLPINMCVRVCLCVHVRVRVHEAARSYGPCLVEMLMGDVVLICIVKLNSQPLRRQVPQSLAHNKSDGHCLQRFDSGTRWLQFLLLQ